MKETIVTIIRCKQEIKDRENTSKPNRCKSSRCVSRQVEKLGVEATISKRHIGSTIFKSHPGHRLPVHHRVTSRQANHTRTPKDNSKSSANPWVQVLLEDTLTDWTSSVAVNPNWDKNQTNPTQSTTVHVVHSQTRQVTLSWSPGLQVVWMSPVYLALLPNSCVLWQAVKWCSDGVQCQRSVLSFNSLLRRSNLLMVWLK